MPTLPFTIKSTFAALVVIAGPAIANPDHHGDDGATGSETPLVEGSDTGRMDGMGGMEGKAGMAGDHMKMMAQMMQMHMSMMKGMHGGSGSASAVMPPLDGITDGKDVIARFDTDGDGALSLAEFATWDAAARRGALVNRYQVLDADGAGAISITELRAAFRNVAEAQSTMSDAMVGGMTGDAHGTDN